MSELAGYFVTGTDTGVGKTIVSLALLECLQQAGLRAIGMKPVASGCEPTAAGLRNDDAMQLRAHSSVQLGYELHNPYAFAPPVAPHIAAQQSGCRIDPERIHACCRQLAGRADRLVVEGVGGWLVPLDAGVTLADLAVRLGLPVVLVVAMRLGCLNHALLTVQAIASAALPLAGWVANSPGPPMEALDENISCLKSAVPAPLLGILPCQQEPDVKLLANRLRLAVR